MVLWNNVVGLEQRFFFCLKSHASLRFGSSRFWKLFLQRSSISNGAAAAPRQIWWVVSWISVERGQASYTLHSTCHLQRRSFAWIFFQTCSNYQFLATPDTRMKCLNVVGPWNHPHKKGPIIHLQWLGPIIPSHHTRVWSARQAWSEPWWCPNGPRRVETGRFSRNFGEPGLGRPRFADLVGKIFLCVTSSTHQPFLIRFGSENNIADTSGLQDDSFGVYVLLEFVWNCMIWRTC